MTQHFTGDLRAQLAEHQAEHGARLLQVAKVAGITRTLARTWQGDRKRERQLKNQAAHRAAARMRRQAPASHEASERNKP